MRHDPYGVYANDRDLRPGVEITALACEIGPDEPRAKPIIIESYETAYGPHRVDLVAIPAGWAPAGKVMRWTNGAYGFQVDRGDGTILRRTFATFDLAVIQFHRDKASHYHEKQRVMHEAAEAERARRVA